MGAWVLFSFLYLLKSVRRLENIISHQCVVQFGSAHCTQHQMYHRPSQTCALYNWMATAFRSIVNSHWVNTQTELWNLSAIIEKQKNNKLCMWHHREWVAVVCWFFFWLDLLCPRFYYCVIHARCACVCLCVGIFLCVDMNVCRWGWYWGSGYCHCWWLHLRLFIAMHSDYIKQKMSSKNDNRRGVRGSKATTFVMLRLIAPQNEELNETKNPWSNSSSI